MSGDDLIRIRTVGGPREPGRRGRAAAVFVGLAIAAGVFVATTYGTFWIWNRQGSDWLPNWWLMLVGSAAAAAVINGWVVQRLDPDMTPRGRAACAVLTAVLGTALGAFGLLVLALATIDFE